MIRISLNYLTASAIPPRVFETCKNAFDKNSSSVEISSIAEKNGISNDSEEVGCASQDGVIIPKIRNHNVVYSNVEAMGFPRICSIT